MVLRSGAGVMSRSNGKCDGVLYSRYSATSSWVVGNRMGTSNRAVRARAGPSRPGIGYTALAVVLLVTLPVEQGKSPPGAHSAPHNSRREANKSIGARLYIIIDKPGPPRGVLTPLLPPVRSGPSFAKTYRLVA